MLFFPHSDLRINESVADVYYDPCQQADEGVENTVCHEYVVVQLLDGLNEQLTDAGDGEDLLNDERTAQNAHKGRNDGGQNGHHGVFQRVAGGCLCAGQTLGARQKHVVGGEGLGQLRTGEAAQSRNFTEGQSHDGQDHTVEHFCGEPRAVCVRQRIHNLGEPVQLEIEYILNQERVNVGGDGYEEHNPRTDHVVLPSVLLNGGNDYC